MGRVALTWTVRYRRLMVAAVDPDDDDIQRYVVYRYAYDPGRHERRHQVVAAFDNQAEYLRLIEVLIGDLRRRRAGDDPIRRSAQRWV
jgi:hypothetical protein